MQWNIVNVITCLLFVVVSVLSESISICHFSDIHSALKFVPHETPGLAALEFAIRKLCPSDRVLTFGGDFLDHTDSRFYFPESHMLSVLNVTAYTLGNHEFDDGEEILKYFGSPTTPAGLPVISNVFGPLIRRHQMPNFQLLYSSEGYPMCVFGLAPLDTGETSRPPSSTTLFPYKASLRKAVLDCEAQYSAEYAFKIRLLQERNQRCDHLVPHRPLRILLSHVGQRFDFNFYNWVENIDLTAERASRKRRKFAADLALRVRILRELAENDREIERLKTTISQRTSALSNEDEPAIGPATPEQLLKTLEETSSRLRTALWNIPEQLHGSAYGVLAANAFANEHLIQMPFMDVILGAHSHTVTPSPVLVPFIPIWADKLNDFAVGSQDIFDANGRRIENSGLDSRNDTTDAEMIRHGETEMHEETRDGVYRLKRRFSLVIHAGNHSIALGVIKLVLQQRAAEPSPPPYRDGACRVVPVTSPLSSQSPVPPDLLTVSTGDESEVAGSIGVDDWREFLAPWSLELLNQKPENEDTSLSLSSRVRTPFFADVRVRFPVAKVYRITRPGLYPPPSGSLVSRLEEFAAVPESAYLVRAVEFAAAITEEKYVAAVNDEKKAREELERIYGPGAPKGLPPPLKRANLGSPDVPLAFLPHGLQTLDIRERSNALGRLFGDALSLSPYLMVGATADRLREAKTRPASNANRLLHEYVRLAFAAHVGSFGLQPSGNIRRPFPTGLLRVSDLAKTYPSGSDERPVVWISVPVSRLCDILSRGVSHVSWLPPMRSPPGVHRRGAFPIYGGIRVVFDRINNSYSVPSTIQIIRNLDAWDLAQSHELSLDLGVCGLPSLEDFYDCKAGEFSRLANNRLLMVTCDFVAEGGDQLISERNHDDPPLPICGQRNEFDAWDICRLPLPPGVTPMGGQASVEFYLKWLRGFDAVNQRVPETFEASTEGEHMPVFWNDFHNIPDYDENDITHQPPSMGTTDDGRMLFVSKP